MPATPFKENTIMRFFGMLLTRDKYAGLNVNLPGEIVYKVEHALKDSVVTGCIRIITDLVGQLPLESDDKELLKLFDNPNYLQTQNTFIRLLTQNTLLYGECFIQIVRSPKNRPVQLNILDNDNVKSNLNISHIPNYTYTDTKSREFPIKHTDMIHIRDILSTGINGISRVDLNLPKIKLLLAANDLIAHTFTSGLNVKWHMQTEASMTPDQKKDFTKSLKKRFAGGSKSKSDVIVTDAGTLQQLKGLTPADTDLRQLRETLIDEVASIFGVPAHLVGGTQEQKYSNVRHKSTSMYRDTVLPIVTNIQQEFSRKLGTRIYFDPTNLIKGDMQSQTMLATQGYAGGILTANEARAAINKPPMDGDEFDTLQPPKTFEIDDFMGSGDEPNEVDPDSTRDRPDKEDN